MSEEKILKELKSINKRLDKIGRAHNAVCAISVWIDCFDPRFETVGDLIKQIKTLCDETLKGKR